MHTNDYISNCSVKMTNCVGEKMSDPDYFAIPAISNSKLKLLNPECDGSVEKYQAGFTFGFNSSLELGTAVHSQILQPEEIVISDYEGKPSGKLGYFIERVYKFRTLGKSIAESIQLASEDTDYYKGCLTSSRLKKAFRDGFDYYKHLSNGDLNVEGKEVLVLPKPLLKTCKKCVNSVLNQSHIKTLLSPNLLEEKIFMNEYAFFADFLVSLPNGDEQYLKLKGKADSIIIDPEQKIVWLNDVKTTSKPIGSFMDHIWEGHVVDGAFHHHRYEIQMLLYLLFLKWHVEKNMGLKDYSYRVNMWAVETTGDNKADCFPVNQAWLDLGKKELKDLLVRAAIFEKYGTSLEQQCNDPE